MAALDGDEQDRSAQRDPAAARTLSGLTGVLSGDLPNYVAHHSFRSSTERQWFLMHVAPVAPLEQGGCVVTHFDVTGWIDPARVAQEPSS